MAANESAAGPKGNTYAVVIGISIYLDTDIAALQFSNRDAVFFADFLMSESGGSVPKKNIKLLIDAEATAAEVEKAIRWLKKNCQKDDKVYFYFSGHGALENVTMYNNGYLICYNTPSVAFVNMGLSIDYLNQVANTLSAQTKANVIIITDACHSGKLAGSKSQGSYLVGEQLMAFKQNEIREIRMASCKTDELSNEKKDWGGGRGVFSYHLVNGLQGGLADQGNDGIVTLGELKSYMDSAMKNDPVLKMDGEVQTPVIVGKNNDFPLSKVVAAETIKVMQQVKEDSVSNANMIVAMNREEEEEMADPEKYFFYRLKNVSIEWLIVNLKLDSIAAEKIAFVLINEFESSLLPEADLKKLEDLKSELKNDKEKLNQFNVSLASLIIDKGQEVIIRYIKGDEAEMERRRYYNYNSEYEVYPKMFAAALKLSQSEEYLHKKSAVLLHYFTGVTLRLKIPVTANPKQLIERALNEQKKALALEEYAAYIYNELGILYQYKKDYTAAEKYLIKATELSPYWAMPQSNLCGLYASYGKYEKATIACNIADSLQNHLQSVSVNRGYIHERTGNHLFAEEYYHNAIQINSRHFLPFERLGYVYMNTANYALADSFFYEADLRKKGFNFSGNDWERILLPIAAAPYVPIFCEVDTSILKPTDIFAFFTWGIQEYEKGDYREAARILKKVIANDKTNPLVFHYMGKIFYDQQKWEEAEVMFKLALKYSLDEEDFKSYVDSVKKSVIYPYDHACFEEFFEKKYYQQIEDHYFIATLYESWQHIEEAEIHLKKIIEIETLVMGGYLKLWRLYEKQGRYIEAEEMIKQYIVVDKEQSERELNAFYRRTIEKFPDDGNWVHRLGLLLYNRASFNARVPYFDSIVWFPFFNKELFVDFEIYDQLDSNYKYIIADRNETGSPANIVLDHKTLIERERSYGIPGTNEYIPLAGVIYTPRKDGITYLKRASELLSEKETLADIHFKIGNIYLWAGSKKQAYPFFEKSLELMPENANTRLTLVDIYTVLFKNRAALQQLNYLYDSSQINFEKRLLLAQFNIHAGWFNEAKQLLDKAEAIHPYMVPEIEDLRGLLNMLNNKPKEAIEFYYRSLTASEMYPGNEVKTFTGSTLYSLSRLYAKTGNNKEALKWLQSAIDFGFNYSFVLQNDPFMDNLRRTAKWKTVINSIPAKKYKSSFASN